MTDDGPDLEARFISRKGTFIVPDDADEQEVAYAIATRTPGNAKLAGSEKVEGGTRYTWRIVRAIITPVGRR